MLHTKNLIKASDWQLMPAVGLTNRTGAMCFGSAAVQFLLGNAHLRTLWMLIHGAALPRPPHTPITDTKSVSAPIPKVAPTTHWSRLLSRMVHDMARFGRDPWPGEPTWDQPQAQLAHTTKYLASDKAAYCLQEAMIAYAVSPSSTEARAQVHPSTTGCAIELVSLIMTEVSAWWEPKPLGETLSHIPLVEPLPAWVASLAPGTLAVRPRPSQTVSSEDVKGDGIAPARGALPAAPLAGATEVNGAAGDVPPGQSGLDWLQASFSLCTRLTTYQLMPGSGTRRVPDQQPSSQRELRELPKLVVKLCASVSPEPDAVDRAIQTWLGPMPTSRNYPPPSPKHGGVEVVREIVRVPDVFWVTLERHEARFVHGTLLFSSPNRCRFTWQQQYLAADGRHFQLDTILVHRDRLGYAQKKRPVDAIGALDSEKWSRRPPDGHWFTYRRQEPAQPTSASDKPVDRWICLDDESVRPVTGLANDADIQRTACLLLYSVC